MILEEDFVIRSYKNTQGSIYISIHKCHLVFPQPQPFSTGRWTVFFRAYQNVLCYLNDILVGGATDAEHICNLGDVLQRLLDHGIKVQNSKCVFLSKSVEYSGHTIDDKYKEKFVI